MAVSIVRELKEADIVELGEEEDPTTSTRRAWLMFDPLAADARFPGIPKLPTPELN
jgi:hypothetical protein